MPISLKRILMIQSKKIDMYKRFKSIETKEDIEDLQMEMIDRFGEFPAEVTFLFKVSSIKLLAREEGVKSISEDNQQCSIILREEESQLLNGMKLFEMISKRGREFTVGTEGKKIKILIKTKGFTARRYLEEIEQILANLWTVKKEV
jgi:transcription-repair coupling factor (superfamily II helicase)